MLKDANAKVAEIMAAAELANDRRENVARDETITQACELAVEIAAKLLKRFDTAGVQTAFFTLFIDALKQMPEDNRTALLDTPDGFDLVSAADLTDSEQTKITKAVEQALGGSPKLTFCTDHTLIAGLEIRTSHFVLHNSWQADLIKILKDLKDAN
jgi:F-type H+-transporting ATPase subunit b